MSAAAALAVAGNLPTPAVVTQPETRTSGEPADPAAGTIQLARPERAVPAPPRFRDKAADKTS